MTLCKYRPQRTYDAQFLLDENDVNGLLKKSAEAAEAVRATGVAGWQLYEGAAMALDVLFNVARDEGEIDMWTDWLATFEGLVGEMEGSDDLFLSQLSS